jgi:PadR family transcriptional regulator, regulatory protein PadR
MREYAAAGFIDTVRECPFLEALPTWTLPRLASGRGPLCKTLHSRMSSFRHTENVVAVFNTMLERPRKSWYGLELAKHADIGSATIYATLTRLERAGLLEAVWENVDPSEVGRPRRRLYKLTGEGARIGRRVVAEYKPRVVPSGSWPRWSPGTKGRTA